MSSGSQLDAVNWPLTALSGAFLFLRIHLKRRQHHGLWWDDHMLVLSWVRSAAAPGGSETDLDSSRSSRSRFSGPP